MAVLKRYRCLGIDGMAESKRGEWVRHEDYLLLVQQLEEIRRNLLLLRDPRYRDIQRKARDEN